MGRKLYAPEPHIYRCWGIKRHNSVCISPHRPPPPQKKKKKKKKKKKLEREKIRFAIPFPGMFSWESFQKVVPKGHTKRLH